MKRHWDEKKMTYYSQAMYPIAQIREQTVAIAEQKAR